MSKIVVYATPFCGFCHAAKQLLARKGETFFEIDVSEDPEKRREMISRAFGRRTVPQIFIHGRHIGGYQELAALDREGKLDPLLGDDAASGAEAT